MVKVKEFLSIEVSIQMPRRVWNEIQLYLVVKNPNPRCIVSNRVVDYKRITPQDCDIRGDGNPALDHPEDRQHSYDHDHREDCQPLAVLCPIHVNAGSLLIQRFNATEDWSNTNQNVSKHMSMMLNFFSPILFDSHFWCSQCNNKSYDTQATYMNIVNYDLF